MPRATRCQLRIPTCATPDRPGPHDTAGSPARAPRTRLPLDAPASPR